MDLADAAAIRRAAEQCLAVAGTPHVLVNNAGVVRGDLCWDHTETDIERTLAVNVAAPMHLTRALLPAHQRLTGLVRGALDHGARLVTRGHGVAEDRYLAPTVLGDVTTDSPIMAEEIFGPVLPIVPVADAAEAVRIIRAGEKPLALYAFTEDAQVRRTLLRDTSSGGVGCGVPMAHVGVPTLPFGGVGGSGMGAYRGRYSVRAFGHAKPVLRKPLAPETLGVVRAPYTSLKGALLRLML